MTPRLRYILSGAIDGFTNMAVDEVLLGECERGVIDGALRVYGWAPPAVSLGYAQSIDLVDPVRCRELGIDLVKRITGGGAVLHWEEVTYCLVLRKEALPALKWPRQFARLTGTALCEALRSLGVEASLSPAAEPRGANGVRSSRGSPVEGRATPNGIRSSGVARSSLCFSSGTENEVTVGGRKLAGCAHKFTREAFFSHGSTMTGAAHIRIVEVVGERASGMSASMLRERSVCLSDLLPSVPCLEIVGRELKRGVETSFGLSLVEGRLSRHEEESAGALSLAKRQDREGAKGVVGQVRFSV
ncbi:MAG: hypothetical protein NTX17_00815 [Candidatus Eisenbacteria bacterium]|nr:hypothetical protein [Candidatus Eisenbacteria bacterium]